MMDAILFGYPLRSFLRPALEYFLPTAERFKGFEPKVGVRSTPKLLPGYLKGDRRGLHVIRAKGRRELELATIHGQGRPLR